MVGHHLVEGALSVAEVGRREVDDKLCHRRHRMDDLEVEHRLSLRLLRRAPARVALDREHRRERRAAQPWGGTIPGGPVWPGGGLGRPHGFARGGVARRTRAGSGAKSAAYAAGEIVWPEASRLPSRSGLRTFSPKLRWTMVEGPAGPRSVALLIAWASVGAGLGISRPACPAGAGWEIWQADNARARRPNRATSLNFTGR